jgi:hypothetical protein
LSTSFSVIGSVMIYLLVSSSGVQTGRSMAPQLRLGVVERAACALGR